MRTNKDTMIFESKEDVINYITKGLAPKSSDAYETFMSLRTPEKSVINITWDPDPGEAKYLASILEQVYENVAFTQKVGAALCGLSGLLGFWIGRRF